MTKTKEEYLIEKVEIPDPKFGFLYIVHSDRNGAILKKCAIWDIKSGSTKTYDGIYFLSSKRYILKESPYEINIYEDSNCGEDHGYASGYGDLWHWSYFAFLDEKEAIKKREEEQKRIEEKYLNKKSE